MLSFFLLWLYNLVLQCNVHTVDHSVSLRSVPSSPYCNFFKWLILGVYLPLLWEPSFCWKSPITLGYTRGHFSALVPMETDLDKNVGAGAMLDNVEEKVFYMPLIDKDGTPLPLHFLTQSQVWKAFMRFKWTMSSVILLSLKLEVWWTM